MQCFGYYFNFIEIWFYDKFIKKYIGSSLEVDLLRSNDRYFEGNGLFQGCILKFYVMIILVKGS